MNETTTTKTTTSELKIGDELVITMDSQTHRGTILKFKKGPKVTDRFDRVHTTTRVTCFVEGYGDYTTRFMDDDRSIKVWI
jgi:hypothetical protein